MHRSIGSLEFRSISKGIEVANEIVKKASVEIIYLKTICPGKFLVIVAGDEDEIEESIKYGLTIDDGTAVDHFIVHAVSDAIIDGFKNKYDKTAPPGPLGIMETNKVCAGIKALDKALKAGDVTLVKMQMAFAIGGKLVFIITGTLSSLEYGLSEAKTALSQGETGTVSIIPSPSQEMTKHLLK